MSKNIQSNLIMKPTAIIRVGDKTLLKRGTTEFILKGDGIHEALLFLSKNMADPISEDEVLNLIDDKQRNGYREIIKVLQSKKIVQPYTNDLCKKNSQMDAYYDEFNPSVQTNQNSNPRIVFVGHNGITKETSRLLKQSGYNDFRVIKDENLDGNLLEDSSIPFITYEELVQIHESVDLLIVSSEIGGMVHFRKWNSFAVEHNIPMYPILLQNMKGTIGPYVQPFETPCYECLRARQNSNFGNPAETRTLEPYSRESASCVAKHPAMVSILSAYAALDLAKDIRGLKQAKGIGSLIEFDFQTSEQATRSLLKIPTCSVCSPLVRQTKRTLNSPNVLPYTLTEA